jgi:hypothetical protein
MDTSTKEKKLQFETATSPIPALTCPDTPELGILVQYTG